MIIDTYYEQDMEIVFSYMPVWEMFASMHVLSRPEHHQERSNWVANVEQRHGELVRELRGFHYAADGWNLVIDSDIWEGMRQMEIPEAIHRLSQMNIAQWNQMIHYYRGAMTVRERDYIMGVIKRYYVELYEREEMILRPFLIKIIREETKKCKSKGFYPWCAGLHPRLLVNEEELLYMKNRDYSYKKKDIRKAYATVSTYLSPHLWMYARDGELEFVKTVDVEKKGETVPQDLLLVLKALADENRIRIVRELLKGVSTTKEMAEKIQISEAAVSKHLKILLESGVAEKHRSGRYIQYKLRQSTIDFIPYQLYEWVLR